ncbi:YdcF family protein [Mucilaginibacter terrigena]|uniref:YdcF family protein n=1 Tax=Mucilaginibacter terrigena TaxID=2492395 RepID=A0A4V1ZBM4_9SPHI|nr:YdcF family protein [Mucilaginibacter terrigena]RYU89437.1 YdcF family protein [Mucilaginibacter terrigena]
MFFILSKVLLVFILPLTWVFALMLYALITKKQRLRKRLLIIATALLYFFSNRFTINAFANLWDVPPYQPGGVKYSCVILLGGFITRDNDGNAYFNWAADRYTKATGLLANHTAQHLLFTGGNSDIYPDGFAEADIVKAELKKKNFPDSLILLDRSARNTLENAQYSKKLLNDAHLKAPYLLVTSAFHMRRAQLIYKRAGVDIVPYPANNLFNARHIYLADFLPASDAVGKWNLYIKEIIGYLTVYFS